jgi:translation elongation factor EF-Ts
MDGLELRKKIQKLREITGAGLLDCKRAIEQSSNMKDAIKYIRNLHMGVDKNIIRSYY